VDGSLAEKRYTSRRSWGQGGGYCRRCADRSRAHVPEIGATELKTDPTSLDGSLTGVALHVTTGEGENGVRKEDEKT
jgi:hypothetical protein